MSESAIFFETNGTGDGAADYTQAQLAAWLRRTFSPTPASEGVLKGYGGELAVSGTSSPLSVAAGAAMVYGFPYESTGVVAPTVSTPSIGTTGFRVVLRVDWSAQTVRIAVKVSSDGVASAPAVTQVANTTWEISLATGTITTGGVVALTDARAYCHFTTAVKTAMLEADSVDDTRAGNRVPQFYRRQGGNSSDWSVTGTTTYTPGAVRMQAGSLSIGAFGTLRTLTFPVAFSQPPVVIFSQISNFSGRCDVDNVTASGCTFGLNSAGSGGDINWLAIGPE